MIASNLMIPIAFLVIGLVFKQVNKFTKDNKEMMKMRKHFRSILIAFFAVLGLTASTAPNALATNSHQDHRGACARSTTSISKGLSDLKYNGVLGKFAKQFGIKSFDGNVSKQLQNQLVVAKVAQAVSTNNSGCDGHGNTFGAGKRQLYKGETVVVKVPAKYGKDICRSSHKGCRAVKIVVHFVLPTSCYNGNTGTVVVVIYVKVTRPPAANPKTKTPAQTQVAANNCKAGEVKDSNGVCSIQQQQVAGAGNCNSTNSGNLSGTGDTQGSCNQTTVVCNGAGSCSPSTTNVCTSNTSGGTGTTGGTGGNASSETCNTTTPPPPAATAKCDSLSVTTNPAVNLGVRAVANYTTSGGATFTSMSISWGDGTTKVYNASNADYIYAKAGNFVVNATLTFSSPSGDLSSNCSAVTVTPKDGTVGPGSTTGGTSGGTGSGGTAGSTTTGSTCQDANGNIVSGPHDQYGYCV
ncbi:MAG: PKD domain-containing protein [Patescibacteria group bacterium]|nr:PKD domain-containing protein [Patescibacteria group bacterium]